MVPNMNQDATPNKANTISTNIIINTRWRESKEPVKLLYKLDGVKWNVIGEIYFYCTSQKYKQQVKFSPRRTIRFMEGLYNIISLPHYPFMMNLMI